MLYLLMQLAALILPGWLLCRLLGIERNRYLFSVSLSYVLFVGIVAAAKLLHWSTAFFYTAYAGIVLLLLVASLPVFLRRTRPALVPEENHFLTGAVIVAGIYIVYRLWAGPYAEVPADLYRHLEYAQAQLYWIEKGFLGPELSPAQLFNQGGQFWYTLYTLLTHLSGERIIDTFSRAMLLNGTLFLLAVYSFAHFLFGKFDFTSVQQSAAALLSAFFVAAHMGINVFAYIRYYSMAPTMLNFVLFFTGILCILMLLEKEEHRWKWAASLAACTLAAALVHNQEALYIAALGALMLGWSGVRNIWLKLRGYPVKYWPGITLRNRQVLLLLALLASAMLVEVWAYTHLQRAPLLQGKVITISAANPFLNRLPILNPEFQFIRVLTIWGGLVYLLFLLNIRRFAPHPYFIAGMALPLFTLFNPLFVDLFLRFDNAHTLWRLCYAIPIHFVGAWLTVHYFKKLTRGAGLLAKGEAIIALTLLFALLLPVSAGNWRNAYARTTLAPVSETNDHRRWGDLIGRLNQQPNRETILTDPITGYVVSALTGHRTFHHKFFPTGEYKAHWQSLYDVKLERFNNWLLLVNLRDGGHSRTGETAQHWPADIMAVSRHYPIGLNERIEENPEAFRPLWKKKRIALYRVSNPERLK